VSRLPSAGDARRWVATDKAADTAFVTAVAIAAVVLWITGRRQWFIRDDFAFLITRNLMRNQRGIDEWLFAAQDGHWMTPPILLYRAIQNVFGIDSYWPFLLPTMIAHVVTVLLVRTLCRRCGASRWTSTLICAALLVFGSGWENVIFAIQITYNLSLVAFLAVIVLVDHDGPVDRRDVLAAIVAVVGVSSSGFGPFFIVGAAVFLVLRGRWTATALVVGPQAVLFAWWYLVWHDDPIAESFTGPRSQVPAYAARTLTATFEGLVALGALTGAAILVAVAVTVRSGTRSEVRRLLVTLWVTALVVFAGVGFSRLGFGIDSAAVSRYRYMGAMLLAPALASGIDALRQWSAAAVSAGRAVLAASVVLNAALLHTSAADWSARSRGAQHLYAVLVGSGRAGIDAVDQRIVPEPYNPDVTLFWLPWLVSEGAVTPRTPVTEAELAAVQAVIDREPPQPDAGSVAP
jgi:hypothetical protein